MTRLMLFTGKGGVGKSTTSAATALYYANQGMKTLLVSSDPAHSTDDTVGTKITDVATEISTNLWAMNINASLVTQERRIRLQTAFQNTFGKMIPTLSDPDSEMGSVFSISNAIPGIDEWGAAEVMGQQFESGEYDLIVFDTAPTGHTLKALASPAHVKQFILQLRRMKKKLMAKLLKGIIFKKDETDDLEEALEQFCDDIDVLRRHLADTQKTKLVLVSIPTEAGFMEFYRTVQYMKSIGLKPQTLVINNIVPDMGVDVWSEAKNNSAVGMVYHEFRNQQEWMRKYTAVCSQESMQLLGAIRLPYEPKGLGTDGRLMDFAKLVCGEDKLAPPEE